MYLEGLEKAGGGRSVAGNEAEGGIGKCLSWVGPEKVQQGPWTWEPETPDRHPVWQLQRPLLPYSDILTVTRGCPTVSSDTQPYTDRHNLASPLPAPWIQKPCLLALSLPPVSYTSPFSSLTSVLSSEKWGYLYSLSFLSLPLWPRHPSPATPNPAPSLE